MNETAHYNHNAKAWRGGDSPSFLFIVRLGDDNTVSIAVFIKKYYIS